MLLKHELLQKKIPGLLRKSVKMTSMFFLLVILLSFQLSSQQLTHRMTEEEKALMPAYLESLRARLQSGPPLAPVRNIAEFEPMEGVLIAYPLGIPVSLVAEMSQDVMVTTIVNSTSSENQARNTYSSGGVNLDNCNFLHAPHDSYWTRDYGPWFVMDGNQSISIINFVYNRPRPNDNNIPVEMAGFLGIDWYDMDLVHTGGNYMTDAWGISVSTDLVWDENTNYTTTRIDQMMYDYLGVYTYHVMEDPMGSYIKHVDCWGKYLAVDKILITRVPQSNSQYDDYEVVADYFANQTSSYGNNYQVYRVYASNGEPYTNSLILNKRVFVPIKGTANDGAAITTYETAMPGYEVIGVSGNWDTTDALHCRVIGIADRGMLYIEHSPLLGEKPQQPDYEISAEIIAYSGMPVIADSVKIYYRVDGGTYYTVDMNNVSSDTYTGSILGQSPGSEIAYYIHAADTSGRTGEHPYIGAPDPHVFTVGGASQLPDAQFTADTTAVIPGGVVNFTDQSSNGPFSWQWTFAGGTPSGSTDQDPSVTYNTPGTYDVTLTVTNAAGSDTETKRDYITVAAALPPVADFSAGTTAPAVGQSVSFADQSTNNPTSWSWTFEGGSPGSSTAQNPDVTYNTPGTYTVELTAANAAGSDTETKTGYITVTLEYCASQGDNYSYEYISNVAVGTFSHDSGGSNYSDFTGQTVNLTAGNTVNVSLTPEFSGSSYTEYWKIRIDYNVDGDFEDAGEEVFSGSGSSVVTGSFTVPADALPGDTRMRVSMRYNSYPPICGSFDYGEVEDYTVNISGGCTQYTLTTNTVGNGTVTSDPAGGTYCEGTVVTLTANPASGWQFDGWSGDLSGTDNPTTVTMDADKNVTATFSETIVPQYSLTVNTVGQGSVTLNPSGGVYNEGTVVTLTASPDSGWRFDNWSGDLSGSANPTTITMNANKTVTANFSEVGTTGTVGYTDVFSLSTTTASRRAQPFTMPENGTISSVTMYHTGGSGSMILGVYDGASLPNNRLGVTATTTVSGSTGWQTINLTSPAFVASGDTVWLAWVYQSNPGIAYESGSPGRASSSQTWSGGMPDPFGSSTTANYLYSIYATYAPSAPPQYTLTTSVAGNGSITLNPPGGVYDAGTEVTLTATPDSGWQFDGWGGDLSGTVNPLTITMTSNLNVTAIFSEIGATGTVGITTVYGSTSTSNYRRALPFTMQENGTITSVTMYHTGGSGNMILGVYDGASTPQNRLAVTAGTAVSGSTGWQTINLTGSAYVAGGSTVWLAWVYESNPGIRYQTGSPGRYQSSQTWSGGMPDPFGSGSQTNYVYSIYATYNK